LRRILRAAKHESRGSSLVEMVLIIFLLVTLVAGLVDIGRVFHSWVVITNASREGARYAARFPYLESEIKQAALEEASGSAVLLYESNVTIIGLNALSGQPIRVKVTYPFQTIMGSVIGVGSVITLTGTTEMIAFGVDI
jgi:Flp pilus assembly protein TadG